MTAPDPGCNFRPRCPFAAKGCELPQVLTGSPHPVRCHRADDVAGKPWPVPELDQGRPGTSGTLLRVENLSRSFGPVRAVNDVSLEITRGFAP